MKGQTSVHLKLRNKRIIPLLATEVNTLGLHHQFLQNILYVKALGKECKKNDTFLLKNKRRHPVLLDLQSVILEYQHLQCEIEKPARRRGMIVAPFVSWGNDL